MILIELTAAIDAAGTLQTFYVGTDSFNTSPTDTPVNTSFISCVTDPGSIGLHAYADGRTGGATKLETGEIALTNVDGQFDAWVNYSFDGRAVTIRSGTGGAYPSAFSTVMTGTIESVESTWKKVIIRLKDKSYLFDLPVLTTLYGGTNVLPAGLDGVATDLQGHVIPRAYGKDLNIAPAFVNTSKLTFQVSGAVADIPAVNDGGAAVTKGADFATSTLLQAAAPATGTYVTCFAEGYFRLGTSPVNQITADVTQGAAAGNRTVAQIVKQLALDAGLTSGEISAADVTALDTLNSAVVGIWINDAGTTFLSAMDQIAASIGAWYGFDSTGTLRMGQLTAPSGTPVVTLQEYDFQDTIERRPPKDHGEPVWSVTVNHTKIWAVQTSGLAGAATAATRGYLAQERRGVNAQDTSIKTQWKLADVLLVDGLLTSATDAATEAARLLALQKVRRDIFDVPISIDLFTANSLKLMDVVGVQTSRYSMSAGRSFRLIGYTLNLAKGTVILTLWG